ncbi:MAG: hypothetical protein AAGM84_11125 [Pseudomonadota bacterium]
MFRLPSLSLALIVALIGTSSTVLAETPLKLAEVSRQLYDAGVEARDPLLVIAAAKLRRGLGIEQTDRVAEGGTAGDGPFDAAAMLDTAEKLAAGDPLMEGLIEDIRAERTKGVTNGPVYNIAQIGGGRTDTYRAVPFDGGKYAEIYVEARDSSDLNLKVFDAQNRLVCSDTDSSAIAYCGWQPRSSGNFTIAVENATGRTVTYNLITN